MELLENLNNILSILFGGTLISIITWKFARRKAAAEALKAEAEAKQAEAEAQKEKQDYYQQMMADLSKDRDYYKQDRDEQRKRQDDMEKKIRDLERDVARNGRMVDALRPFICTDLTCLLRHHAVISENGEVKEIDKKTKKKDQGNDL